MTTHIRDPKIYGMSRMSIPTCKAGSSVDTYLAGAGPQPYRYAEASAATCEKCIERFPGKQQEWDERGAL